jgi:hypothetical protein
MLYVATKIHLKKVLDVAIAIFGRFQKKVGMTTLPTHRVKSSLHYILAKVTTLAPAGKVVTPLYY